MSDVHAARLFAGSEDSLWFELHVPMKTLLKREPASPCGGWTDGILLPVRVLVGVLQRSRAGEGYALAALGVHCQER